jgi:HEAT repeat protein
MTLLSVGICGDVSDRVITPPQNIVPPLPSTSSQLGTTVLPMVLATSLSLMPMMPSALPPDEVVIKRLVESLKDGDPEVRTYLAVTIAKFGSAAVEPLVAALKDNRSEKRAGAAYTLGQLGVMAKSAVPQLLELLDDADANVRRQSAYALSRIVTPGTGGNR